MRPMLKQTAPGGNFLTQTMWHVQTRQKARDQYNDIVPNNHVMGAPVIAFGLIVADDG